MSAVLDLLERRERHPTTLVLPTANGPLAITWTWNVDKHELAKARSCGDKDRPWREVLNAVTKAIDCEGASVEGPPM
jgi:hypothetical protein